MFEDDGDVGQLGREQNAGRSLSAVWRNVIDYQSGLGKFAPPGVELVFSNGHRKLRTLLT